MEILKIVIWPLTVIVIVIFFVIYLRKPLKAILNGITKFQYGKAKAEVSQTRNQGDNLLEANDQVNHSTNKLDKALGVFSDETLLMSKSIVESESDVNSFSSDSEKASILFKYSQALYLILSFERIYNLIFGSQLYLLDYINSANNETKESLMCFYDNAISKYASFYESYSYEEYFTFLLRNELLNINSDGIVKITWFGRDFLKYLIETGKPFSLKY